MNLICPVCGGELTPEPKRYICKKGHSFDRAKSGYVNLLQRQSRRQRGDDAEMAKARQVFLNAGYYQKLLDRICAITLTKKTQQIMDVGCGEGWYSCAVTAALRENGCQASLCGVDISPDILRFAAVRAKQQGIPDADWAVASVNHLPTADHSCDCILNLFAPCEPAEFLRILKPDGILLRVIPLEKHLWELKQAVYEQPYENKPVTEAPEGFVLDAYESLTDTITVPAEHLKALFAMTPYIHKTSEKDIAKLDSIESLTTTISFGILICKPKK
ncbi:MAG: methyltransferase domain-containing protein [Oscillospiraceae bacterium]|nr:methyltransferase domain-containing protein [Oscillospiraceae bacterium]